MSSDQHCNQREVTRVSLRGDNQECNMGGAAKGIFEGSCQHCNKRMKVSLKVEIHTASGEGEATKAPLRVSDQHCNRRRATRSYMSNLYITISIKYIAKLPFLFFVTIRGASEEWQPTQHRRRVNQQYLLVVVTNTVSGE